MIEEHGTGRNMRIMKVGHSEVHPRQALLSLELAKDIQNVEIMSFSPKEWSGNIAPKYVVGLDAMIPEGEQPHGFNNIILKGLEVAAGLKPDIVWAMEEPWTYLTWQCRCIAKSCGAKFVVFTWENIEGLRPAGAYGKIEQQVLAEADLVICGNSGAERRVHSIEPKAKTKILPQTGISTEIFKPLSIAEKLYDIGSFGRFVEEKMGMWNKLLEARPGLKSLTIGGKGDLKIASGEVLDWHTMDSLPLCYNSLKCFVTLPYNHEGYNEQFNYTIAEALACGLPVIASNNGSIPEIYDMVNSVFLVDEGYVGVGQALYYFEKIFTDITQKEREEMSIRGRQWVIENLSLQAIAKRYLDTFKEVLNG